MKRMLEDKVAIVTGGASGIGRATAMIFAREGAKVVVADVIPEGGYETVQLIKEAGNEAMFVKCDVSKAVEVEAMVKKAVDTYGQLDCAFNNAGIGMRKPTIDLTEEDWERVIGINLKGVWLCKKYEVIQMLKQGGGAIVNTSSAAGLLPLQIAPAPAYTASKHGVVGLTKAAALEYAQKGIRVNAICPGGTRTPMLFRATGDKEISFLSREMEEVLGKMHPMGRICEPEEIAEAVLWLCSGASSFVTGVVVPVDGGVVAGK
jgi:NAD(P)-dependent dehydrogenase (short-subunit alcohol dehydrogenase family)